MKNLRHYQIECKEAIQKDLDAGIKKLMVVLPTGAGKTFTAVDIIRDMPKKLWITHSEELCDQSGSAMLSEYYPEVNIKDMITAYGGLTDYVRYIQKNPIFADMSENQVMKNVSIIKADLFGLHGEVVIASAQTLHRRLDKIKPDLFDVVVADEVHLFGSKTFSKGIMHFDPKLLLGLTATPHRMDGMMLGDIFDKISYQYSIGDAIRDGYLCELDAIAVRTKLNLDNVHTLGGEFNQSELSASVDTPERNALIVDSYEKYAKGLQVIVFCVDVAHAQNICQTFKDRGYTSEFIVGDEELTPDRKAMIQRFKNGQTQILSNCQILTAGFDYPALMGVVMACPTKSLTKYMQSLGRSTRTLSGVIDIFDEAQDRRRAIKLSGKPKAIILDIVDVTSKHKLINTFELDKKKPIEERVFTTSEKKKALLDARSKAKIDTVREKDERVQLFEVPEVEFSQSMRMQEPATEKQLAVIKDKGYDIVNTNYTKAQCNIIISNLPASTAQINFLKWKKYDIDGCPGLTYGQFQLAKKEIDARELKESQQKQISNNRPIEGAF